MPPAGRHEKRPTQARPRARPSASSIEILSVDFPARAPRGLRALYIDNKRSLLSKPAAAPAALPVVGWVLGADSRAVAVEILYRDRVIQTAPVEVPRPDVARDHPEAPEAERSGFSARIDARRLSAEFELGLTAVLEDETRVPIGSIQARHGHGSDNGSTLDEPGAAGEAIAAGEGAAGAPSLREDLRELILASAAAHPKTARGGLDLLERDPRQTPPSGDSEPRIVALDRLHLEGKKVLDLGAGVGELSRAARARGASLVDGLERDRGLVALARLLNAYHRVARVSFYERDVSRPVAYSERYDVVLAFSVLPAVRRVLERIAGFTDGVFVTELTPDSQRREREATLAAIEAWFPALETLDGEPAAPGGAERHQLVIGARDEPTLRASLRPSGLGGSRRGRP